LSLSALVWAIVTSSFWFTFSATIIPIRWLADGSPRLRLYLRNGRPVVTLGNDKPWRRPKQIHIHHFEWGFPLTLISWVLFVTGYDAVALALAGIASALWFSEAKEIVKQKWGR
jgi:hypothetical protein